MMTASNSLEILLKEVWTAGVALRNKVKIIPHLVVNGDNGDGLANKTKMDISTYLNGNKLN